MAVIAADPELVTAAFRDFDPCGDGKISREDLTTLLQKLDPDMMSGSRVDLLIDEFSSKSPSGVDYSEFIMWLLAGYSADVSEGEAPATGPSLMCCAPPGVWAGWNCWQKGLEPCPQVLWLDAGTLQVLGAGTAECNGIYKGSAKSGFEHANGRTRVAWDAELGRFHLNVRQAQCYFTNIGLPELAETEGSGNACGGLTAQSGGGPPSDEWGGWEPELSKSSGPNPRVAWLGCGTLQVIGAGSAECNGVYKRTPGGEFENANGKAKVLCSPAHGRYEIVVQGAARYSTLVALPGVTEKAA